MSVRIEIHAKASDLKSRARRQEEAKEALESAGDSLTRLMVDLMGDGTRAWAVFEAPPGDPDPAWAWLSGPVRVWEEQLAQAKAQLEQAEREGRRRIGMGSSDGALASATQAFLSKSDPASAPARCALACARVSNQSFGFDFGAGEQASRLGWIQRSEGEPASMRLDVDADGSWRVSGGDLLDAAGRLNQAAWPFAPWRAHADGSVEFHPDTAAKCLACAWLAASPWTGRWLQMGAPSLEEASRAAKTWELGLSARLWTHARDPFERLGPGVVARVGQKLGGARTLGDRPDVGASRRDLGRVDAGPRRQRAGAQSRRVDDRVALGGGRRPAARRAPAGKLRSGARGAGRQRPRSPSVRRDHGADSSLGAARACGLGRGALRHENSALMGGA